MMKKLTVKIDDALLRQMKRKAAAEERSLQAVVNELLQRALTQPTPNPFRLRLQPWKAELRPGIDISDRNSLFSVLDKP